MVTLHGSISAPDDPDPAATTMLLEEHETTGPLPVGFEFERFGTRFDHFDLSTDGFIKFGRGAALAAGRESLPLTETPGRWGGGRVAYAVRGSAPRRRLVVSFIEPGVLRAAFQVTVHERTGIIELLATPCQSFGDPTIRQLDNVQTSPLRENSARKMG